MYKWILFLLLLPVLVMAQDNEECYDCHGDEDLIKIVNDSIEISLWVDQDHFENSIHGDLECIDCHTDITDAEHDEDLEPVSCENCHDDSYIFIFSPHGIPGVQWIHETHTTALRRGNNFYCILLNFFYISDCNS